MAGAPASCLAIAANPSPEPSYSLTGTQISSPPLPVDGSNFSS